MSVYKRYIVTVDGIEYPMQSNNAREALGRVLRILIGTQTIEKQLKSEGYVAFVVRYA